MRHAYPSTEMRPLLLQYHYFSSTAVSYECYKRKDDIHYNDFL